LTEKAKGEGRKAKGERGKAKGEGSKVDGNGAGLWKLPLRPPPALFGAKTGQVYGRCPYGLLNWGIMG